METPDIEIGASHLTTLKHSLTLEQTMLDTPATKKRLVSQVPTTSKDTLNSLQPLVSQVASSSSPVHILRLEEEAPNRQEDTAISQEDWDNFMNSERFKVIKRKSDFGWWLLAKYRDDEMHQLPEVYRDMPMDKLTDYIYDCITYQ